jgi:chemotaxis methyl-accepting protein methylase
MLRIVDSGREGGHGNIPANDAVKTWSRHFNAIFCRGVLNDVLSDDDRQQIARRFALILDVRDWLKKRAAIEG